MSGINLFIDKLEFDFNIKIIESSVSLKWENTFKRDICNNITMLNLEDIKLKKLKILSPIVKHLKTLSLIDCDIKNTENLEEFTQLEELDLSGNPICNLKGIDKLVNLTKLCLSFTEIISTKEIQTLNRLKKIDLYCTKLSSITDLENLKYLEELILPSTIKTFDSICTIKSLKKINSINNFITEIKGLERFPNLEELNLFCNNISVIKGLEMLHKLKVLNLAANNITEIKGLECLENLEVLNLGLTSIPQIKGLEGLVNLKELNLTNYLGESETPLAEIKGLKHLSKLEKLILTGHRIKELKDLPTDSLKLLDVSWNDIEWIDYKLLESIQTPCTINLTGNPVNIRFEKIPKHITIINKRKDN